MSTIRKAGASATFMLQDITKGAVRYQEINEHGNEMKMYNPETLIGTQYLRQGKFKAFRDAEGNWPQYITITVTPGLEDASLEA
jgi:hypothetical protein